MLTFLLIPALICGVLWMHSAPKSKYRISTYQGWLVYIHAAKYGIVLLGATYILIEGINLLINDLFSLINEDFNKNSLTIIIADCIFRSLPSSLYENSLDKKESIHEACFLISLSFLSIFLSYIIILSAKKIIWNDDFIKYTILQKFWYEHSIFDHFILTAMQKNQPILLTLSTNKCYVGIINRIQEPNEETTIQRHIELVPILSGYRAKDEQEIIFTTRYYKDLSLTEKPDDLDRNTKIIIPASMITSTSEFNVDIFNKTSGNPIEK